MSLISLAAQTVLLLIIVAVSTSSLLAAEGEAGVRTLRSPLSTLSYSQRRAMDSFDLKCVSLDGSLRRQFDEVREYYLAVPNDDYLKPYRRRAGLPAPGADLGGCYVSHSPLPQIISGLARMYAAAGDARCRDKAIALLDGWAECIAPDGFFFAEENPTIIHYFYDKWVGALVDMLVYANYPKAAGYLARITDWADKNLSRVRQYANPQGNDGGEWYTLTENLLRAYVATGDERYRSFAEIWEYTDFWKLLAEGKDIFENLPKPTDYNPWYHAYSHVNSLCGLAACYMARNDRWYLDTLIKAWDTLMKDQVLVTGGYGQDECLVPLQEQVRRLGATHSSFETQCGFWAAFKISEYLITLTREARYGDWAELLVTNGAGASIPMSAKGEVFYYSDYCTSGGKKVHNQSAWPCCSGTRAQAVPEYHDLIYYKDADGIFVNLYAASSVTWEKGRSVVTVRQVTNFPESEVVNVIVECGKRVRFALRLRRPNWLAAPMTAAINGQSVALTTDDKGWAVIDRVWSGGDKLTIRLPMGFRVSRPDPAKQYPAALAYGPVTLAARYAKGNPARLINPGKAAEDFEPVPGETLSWRLKSEPDLLLRPFYRYKEGEAYFVYLDPNIITPASFSHTDATFGGGEWKDYGGWSTSPQPGAWAEIDFEGENLRVRGYRFDDAGRFAVIVDGKRVGVIDQYGPDRGQAATWEFAGLGSGKHKLRLEHLDERSPESKGHFVNVAGFDCGF